MRLKRLRLVREEPNGVASSSPTSPACATSSSSWRCLRSSRRAWRPPRRHAGRGPVDPSNAAHWRGLGAVDLRVIGCHGGETPKHRTSAFVVGGKLAIDAGSITSGMTVADQVALDACLVSHAHLDHVRDLATLADNRCQMRCAPLVDRGRQGDARRPARALLQQPDLARLHQDPERRSADHRVPGARDRDAHRAVLATPFAPCRCRTRSRLSASSSTTAEMPSRTAATRVRPTASGSCSTRSRTCAPC